LIFIEIVNTKTEHTSRGKRKEKRERKKKKE